MRIAPLLPLLCLTFSFSLGLGACDRGADRGGAEGVPRSATDGGRDRPRVATTFYPTAWLLERLAGDAIEVLLPLPAGADPSTWQPTREDLQVYQGADLIVTNGAGLEAWVASASLPLSRLVQSAAGFQDRWRQYEGLTHSHGGGGQHSHLGTDGHTWMSPALLILQAERVAEALESHGLVPRETLQPGLKALRSDLTALERELNEALLPRAQGVRFLANHPAFDYLLAEHVDLINLDLDPEAEDVEAIVAAVRKAKAEADKCLVLWESEPRSALSNALERELGVPSVVFRVAENPARDEDGKRPDYLDLQGRNFAQLSSALERL